MFHKFGAQTSILVSGFIPAFSVFVLLPIIHFAGEVKFISTRRMGVRNLWRCPVVFFYINSLASECWSQKHEVNCKPVEAISHCVPNARLFHWFCAPGGTLRSLSSWSTVSCSWQLVKCQNHSGFSTCSFLLLVKCWLSLSILQQFWSNGVTLTVYDAALLHKQSPMGMWVHVAHQVAEGLIYSTWSILKTETLQIISSLNLYSSLSAPVSIFFYMCRKRLD